MKRIRFLIFSGIGIAASIITIFFYSQKIEFFSAIDLKLKDARLKLRKAIKPDPNVVIATIDAKSINELGRWPWDRSVTAKLIENLKSYGAKTICLDIVFSEPTTPLSDMALSSAVKKSGNVITGYFLRHEEETQPALSKELLDASKIKILRLEEGVTEVPIISFPYVEVNIPSISESTVSSGFFNVIPDGDGIIRNANLLMLYEGEIYPSLPLSGLRHYLGGEIILNIAQFGVEGLLIGERQIPADEQGRLTVNYYGKQGVFKTVSAVDIIKGRLSLNALKDTLVFVGPTEIGIADLRATPLDPALPGVEIHATVASSILQKKFLIRDGRVITLEVLFIIFFSLILTMLLSLFRRTFTALLIFLAIAGFYWLVDRILFQRYLLNTSMLYTLISITLSYLGSEAYRNLIEEQQSRFLKKAFSSYVSVELVAEIIKNPNLLKLGGEKREITVLFSDIRDFTSISERLSPENLVLLLNHYLGPMTHIVLKHKGTLDKYIGDAIMAIYNAPLSIEEHSVLASKTGLEMIEKLKELNAEFKQKGFMEIDIGIGINTGPAIVGNMGTDVRFDYTAIGDTVNLSSRLEGLNKLYKTHILLTEFTVNHLNKTAPHKGLNLREIDFIKVKGKDKPVTVYELSVGLKQELIERFQSALSLYRRQQFKEAKDAFQSLYTEYKDMPSGIFIARCDEFIEDPPPSQWDGVYVAKIK